jgi:hypothetical protein
MTDRGVPDGEMVDFPWQTREEFRTLEALLSCAAKPEDAPAGLRPVAEVLAALQAPPDTGEHAGWNQALAVFREAPATPAEHSQRRSRPQSPRSRRPGPRSAWLGPRLAAAAVTAAVAAFGGGIAAAYAGMLPAALQRIAHDTIAAPDVSPPRPTAAATDRGPGSAGPSRSAAPGLCTAYARAEAHGSKSQRAAAFRKLVNAAGGEDKVAAYCAPIPSPGTAAPPGTATPPGHRHGRSSPPASSPPSAAHPSHPGKPTAPPGHGHTATPSHGPVATPSHGKKS